MCMELLNRLPIGSYASIGVYFGVLGVLPKGRPGASGGVRGVCDMNTTPYVPQATPKSFGDRHTVVI